MAPLGTDPVTAEEVQAQLERILASVHFCKARCGSRLLRYLVGDTGDAALRLTNEYAIGLDVFGRDVATYSTGDDPIVRVQVGRLRDRLKAYYNAEGKADPLRISIPLGAYAPHFERVMAVTAMPPRLAFVPLTCSQGDAAGSFSAGLNDELSHRLYRQLGDRVRQCGQWRVEPSRDSVSHVLEGSVRADGITVRTSLRLLDVPGGSIVWSEQVDHGNDLSIARQEHLAGLCCRAVHEHFVAGNFAESYGNDTYFP